MKAICLSVSVTLIFALLSCQKEAEKPEHITEKSANAGKPHKRHGHMGPEHGHINCPYASKKGGSMAHHGHHGEVGRPFTSTSEYIKRLESPERVKWQKPDEVIRALALKGNELVTDVGAGSGFFAFRFAKALPRGRVVALDIDGEMVAHMERRLTEGNVTNLTVKKVSPQKPVIDPLTDIVFINNVLHHVEKRLEWLKQLHAQMKPGSRLVLLEFRMGKLPTGPPESMRIPRKNLIKLLALAGFSQVQDKPGVLPYQEFLIFPRK